MAVKVVLRQDVPNLGEAGEVKQVAPGYFRNFLLPRGLAIEASKGQMRALQASSSTRSAQADRVKEQAQALARQIESTTVSVKVKVGEQGRIYGSVTTKDIAEELQRQAGISVDRHKIETTEPLKSVGMHTVSVKLDRGVEGQLKVEVTALDEAGA